MKIYYIDYHGDLCRVQAQDEQEALSIVEGKLLMTASVEDALSKQQEMDAKAKGLMKGKDER